MSLSNKYIRIPYKLNGSQQSNAYLAGIKQTLLLYFQLNIKLTVLNESITELLLVHVLKILSVVHLFVFSGMKVNTNKPQVEPLSQEAIRTMWAPRMPTDFKEKLLSAIQKFSIRKEQVTRMGRKGTITTITISRVPHKLKMEPQSDT